MTNFCLDFCIRLILQNRQISLELDLLVRPAGIVYQWTCPATEKFNAFQVNFSEFNNKLVAAFTTNGVENSVSFHCLTFFFLLWMLKNTFTTFPVSSQVFWFQIRAEIPKATPIFAFHESSKPSWKLKFSLKCNSVRYTNFGFNL